MNVKPNDVRPYMFENQRHHDGSDSDVDKDSTDDYRPDEEDKIEDIYQSQTHCIDTDWQVVNFCRFQAHTIIRN